MSQATTYLIGLQAMVMVSSRWLRSLSKPPHVVTAIMPSCELLLTFSEGRQWTLEFLGVTHFSRLENRLIRDVYTRATTRLSLD